ncbi:MAG: Crp/Fnr family transcriptional regulator [Calditrichaeota bacterium]|nr:Crp/Fnr family transcriptional regulator [Calditrichota bacterium]
MNDENVGETLQLFLSDVFLFESLTPEQLKIFSDLASIKEVPRGSHVFHEGQPASAFFIVFFGMLKIYKLSSDGAEQILHIHKTGDLIAEAVIFDFDEFPAYCQAIADSALVRFPKQEFLEALRCFPEISFQIMRAYSRRIRQLVAKIEEISLHDVRARLANFLLQNCIQRNEQHLCQLNISKKDLASTLGTIPETLSRALQFFKREGLIREVSEGIVVLKEKELRRVVGE